MLKKKVSMLIIVVVLIMQSFSGLGFLKEANASATVITDDILTGVTLTVTDHGVPVTGTVYSQGADVTLDFTWAIPNGHSYVTGATYTFKLPDEIKLFSSIHDSPLVMDEGSVGTFSVDQTSKQVVMTFNDYIVKNQDVKGTMTFNSQFDVTHITGTSEQLISFPIKNGPFIATVYFKPKVDNTIEKNGVAQGYNAKKINWTVDVNKKMEIVNKAVVTDTIPAGLSIPSVISVTYLDIELDGTAKVRPGLAGILDPSNYSFSTDGREIKVSFKDAAATINSAFRISYVTDILNNGLTFTNLASFSGENLSSIVATATVNVQRGEHLAKKSTSYNSVTQTVYWEIKYNYDEMNIAQAAAILTDLYNKSQDLVPGSLKVQEVTLNSSGVETGTSDITLNVDYSLGIIAANATVRGFTIQFLNNLTKAYKIVYQTKSMDRVESNETINNTVTSSIYTKTGSVGINQVVIAKKHMNEDYLNKTVEWEITINKDLYTMKDVVIKDTFDKGGLEFIPGSVVVKNKSNAIVDPSNYIVDSSVLATVGFTLTFKSTFDISEEYRISYKTKFDKYLITNGTDFYNKAHIDWKDTLSVGHSLETTAVFNPRDEVDNNGYKSGSYNAVTKEITWKVGINYNSKTLSSAKLVDILLNDQLLVSDSIKVSNMIIGTNGNPTAGTTVSSSVYTVTMEPGNTLNMIFVGSINSPYILEFKTSLKGKVINPIDNHITNKANLYNGIIPESGNLTASVTVPTAGEYAFKKGVQADNKINWKIYVNRGQSEVDNATILDTPSDNQLLDPDSFHLFGTIISGDGTSVTKNAGIELVKGTDYDLIISTDANGKQSFTLKFKNKIKTAYLLEYQSIIVANNGDHVTNVVEFSGDNVIVGTKQSTEDFIVGVSSGSGTGSGVRGILTVTKVDEDKHAVILPGATFVLYRVLSPTSRILINTLVSDVNGKAEFKNLLSGNYVLIETVAPVGYLLDSREHTVLVDSTHTVIALTVNNKIKPVVTTSPTPVVTTSPTPVVTPSPTPEATSSPTPSTSTPNTSSPTPIVTPTATPTAVPTATPDVVVPLETPKAEPSEVPTATPTSTPAIVKEVTKQDIPKTGTIEVPDGSVPSIGKKPNNGVVTVSPDGKWIYTPKPGFIGKDKFSIIVTDEDGNEEETFIDIDVEEVPLGVTNPEATLPKTGETSYLNVQIAGILLMMLGLGFMLRRRFSKRS